jgi:glycosyltransferase involved in cell wall biosynthesis
MAADGVHQVVAGRSPRVSIGVPVYNGERYVAETLDSLLAQSFGDFELIICDNTSADRTQEICQYYAARDSRIRYVRNPNNLGLAANYRLGFALSSGEYFRWNASDDLCAPQFLVRCVEVLDRNASVVLAYPKTKLIDEHGKLIADYEDRLQLDSDRPSQRFIQLNQNLRLCNALYGLIRSETLRRTALVGSFIGGDIPLLAELVLYGKFREVPEFLFFRRIHPQAASVRREDQLLELYDPKKKFASPLTTWRHYHAYFRGVTRAPLPLAEKARFFARLLRMATWSRCELLGELRVAIAQKLQGRHCHRG